jgi:drug/metabolite transporter (DMT)-like permease
MATIYGLLAILMWGGLALLGSATTAIPAFQLLALCFFISTLIVIIKRIVTRQPILRKPTLRLSQWFFGIGGLFGFHFCFFMALKYAPAIEVSLIVYLWPMLLAIFVATRATLINALVGSIIGFIGISFILIGDASVSLNQQYLPGYVLAIICAIIWSSYSWYLSKSDNEVEDIGWLSLAVAMLSLFAHFQLEQSSWQFSLEQWFGIILLGLGPVGGAFYLWDIGLKQGNKNLLASLSFCAPLISAVALSVAGLNAWSNNILIALALIVIGAIIANKSQLMAKIRPQKKLDNLTG